MAKVDKPVFHRGDAVSDPAFREKLQAMADRAWRPILGDNVEDHPSYVLHSEFFTPTPIKPFWARITSGTSPYGFQQVFYSGTGYQDLPGGLKGNETGNPAYEDNSKLGIPPNNIVWMRPNFQGGIRNFTFDLGVRTDTVTGTAGNSTETEAESTDTWDVTNQSDKRGVVFTCISRVVYDDTGDETLYAYYRDLTFDAVGHLTLIGTETRVTIDAPESC